MARSTSFVIWAAPAIAVCLLLSAPQAPATSKNASRHHYDQDYYEVINGTYLHFRVRGRDRANPYLVILHGGPGSSAIEFYPWGELLFAFENMVRDIEGVRRRLGVDRWFVLGHSFGGMVGLEYLWLGAT